MTVGVAVKVERSSDEIIGESQIGIFSYFITCCVIIIHLLLTEFAGPSPKKARVEPQFHTRVKIEQSIFFYMCM